MPAEPRRCDGYRASAAHFVPTSLTNLEVYALDHIEISTFVSASEHAADFGSSTPAEALAQLRDLTPFRGSLLPRYRDVAEAAAGNRAGHIAC